MTSDSAVTPEQRLVLEFAAAGDLIGNEQFATKMACVSNGWLERRGHDMRGDCWSITPAGRAALSR